MMTTDQEAAYRATLAASLLAGHTCLAAGGSALVAVCAAVQVMEDSPLFIAGLLVVMLLWIWLGVWLAMT